MYWSRFGVLGGASWKHFDVYPESFLMYLSLINCGWAGGYIKWRRVGGWVVGCVGEWEKEGGERVLGGGAVLVGMLRLGKLLGVRGRGTWFCPMNTSF